MSTKYTYSSLPPGTQTIRLLELQPAAADADPLQASLVDALLGHPSQPAYEAISYVWGDSIFPETLHLEGSHGELETLAITANLARCLVGLRRPHTPRVLWVDAVCIDQENPEEKGSQISLMGRIYQTAMRVLIWLGMPVFSSGRQSFFDPSFVGQPQSGTTNWKNGESSIWYQDGKRFMIWPEQVPSASAAGHPQSSVHVHVIEVPAAAEEFTFRLRSGEDFCVRTGKRSSSPIPAGTVPLDGFGLLHSRASDLLAKDVSDSRMEMRQSLLREGALFNPTGPFPTNVEIERVFRYGISEIYTHPWFTRMWVVQEVCLATEAVLLHGGREMDWVDFSLAMNLLQVTVQSHNIPIPAPPAFERACELVRVTNLYKATQTSTETADQQLRFASQLSYALRTQHCKLDHDRVYALFSLHPEGSPLRTVVPDYTTPIPRLFREFAAKQLELGMLDVLYNAGVWERRGMSELYLPCTSSESDKPATLPSWAPDLRLGSRNQHLPWLKHYFRQRLESKSLNQEKHAAPIQVTPTPRGFSLDVEVLMIDRFKAVADVPNFPHARYFDPNKPTRFDTIISHIQACRQLFEKHKNPSGYPLQPTPPTKADMALWATLVSFSAYTATPTFLNGTFLSARGLQDCSRHLQKHCLDDGGAFSGGRRRSEIALGRAELIRQLKSEGEDPHDWVDAVTALTMCDVIGETMGNVRFMVTHDGFIGLAPPTVLADRDIVVMVRGARVPLILRPLYPDGEVTREYVLVGSCYVFGLMDWIIQGEYKTAHLF